MVKGETIALAAVVAVIGLYTAGLIYLNSRVRLKEKETDRGDRPYTESPWGVIKISVTLVGLFFGGLLVLIVAFGILIALTPGRLE